MLIIASLDWIDPTRAVGLIAYATAFICCGITSLKLKATRQSPRLAAILMLIEGVLLMDTAFNWRWKLHQALVDFTIQKHEYDQRSMPQSAAVMLLAGLLLAGLFVGSRMLRGRASTFLAVSGAMLSVVVCCLEVVSLHAMDHILYHSMMGVKIVSFLWILSCLMTSVGILSQAARSV